MDIDNRVYKGQYEITISQVNIFSKDDTTAFYPGIFYSLGAGENGTLGRINLRNIEATFTDPSVPAAYIYPGQRTVEAYKLELSAIPENSHPKDVQTLYYDFKYGVIACKLFSGEKFELGEEFIGD